MAFFLVLRRTEIVDTSCTQVVYCLAYHTHHNQIGAGVGFERTRRITGYLVGTLDRFNDAKRSEEHDRVKHAMTN